MIIRSVAIENFRSLESVKLEGLGQMNVLIGRNNAGKSAVFGALQYVQSILVGEALDWAGLPTARDTTRSIQSEITFELEAQERHAMIAFFVDNLESDRAIALNRSPFLRRLTYVMASAPSHPGIVHLTEIRLLTEDNCWVPIHQLKKMSISINPESYSLDFAQVVREGNPLTAKHLDVAKNVRISQHFSTVGYRNNPLDKQTAPVVGALLDMLIDYFRDTFFFNPFRHSSNTLPVDASESLAPDGGNLAQVLHTINSNNRRLLQDIENFIHGALPGLGTLLTPLDKNSTSVAFAAERGGYRIGLHEMGGGIEQLLMVATVLLTTSKSPIFLEEPESHLHAGAQRFLFEQLSLADRQIFITTHSPVFLNQATKSILFQIRNVLGRSELKHIGSAEILGSTLDDIGARNGDVLLSDAVLFVEGPSDKKVLDALAKKTRISLEKGNVTIIPMGGGSDATRSAHVRSDVLQRLSRGAIVPHLFVLDRDERSDRELSRLETVLGKRVHVLKRREIENYLLVPTAIRAAIEEKYFENDVILERLRSLTNEQVEGLIREAASGLEHLVLIKRIRADIPGFSGGIFPAEQVLEMVSFAEENDLHARILDSLRKRAEVHLSAIKMEQVVKRHRKDLTSRWSKPTNRLALAPGEEILSTVFRKVGGEYRKSDDAERIARHMLLENIENEIIELLTRAAGLRNE